MRRRSLAILLTVALTCAAAAHAQNARPVGDAANGKRIYMADGCALCHGTVGQGGRGTGPHIAPSPLPFEAFAGQVRRPANAMPAYTKSCCRADSANSLATTCGRVYWNSGWPRK